MTAINRNQSSGYQLENLMSGLPNGTYYDVLENLLGGGNNTGNNGSVSEYYLGAGQCAVWQYTANEVYPIIGNINPKMSKPGNTVTITGRGFGNSTGSVTFGTANAQIVSWSDSMIKAVVPGGVVRGSRGCCYECRRCIERGFCRIRYFVGCSGIGSF